MHRGGGLRRGGQDARTPPRLGVGVRESTGLLKAFESHTWYLDTRVHACGMERATLRCPCHPVPPLEQGPGVGGCQGHAPPPRTRTVDGANFTRQTPVGGLWGGLGVQVPPQACFHLRLCPTARFTEGHPGVSTIGVPCPGMGGCCWGWGDTQVHGGCCPHPTRVGFVLRVRGVSGGAKGGLGGQRGALRALGIWGTPPVV